MIEKLIKDLQDKHDAFIGNQKDQITSAEAKGFKQGLAWAIESAKTMIRIAEYEEEYSRGEVCQICHQELDSDHGSICSECDYKYNYGDD